MSNKIVRRTLDTFHEIMGAQNWEIYKIRTYFFLTFLIIVVIFFSRVNNNIDLITHKSSKTYCFLWDRNDYLVVNIVAAGPSRSGWYYWSRERLVILWPYFRVLTYVGFVSLTLIYK